MHGEERQDQCDAADYSGGEYSWMCELGVESQHADDQQDEKYVRLHDAREEFFATAHYLALLSLDVEVPAGSWCRPCA